LHLVFCCNQFFFTFVQTSAYRWWTSVTTPSKAHRISHVRLLSFLSV
jgi:hypothetical protein